MRCDEIKERFVELLYDERGTVPASPELRAHIDSCPSCRKELEDLKALQGVLRNWKDEQPLRPVWIPQAQPLLPLSKRGFPIFKVLRYAGVAALVTLAFLAVSNAEFTRTRDGFAFRTHAFSWAQSQTQEEYITKPEMLKIVKEAVSDSESYMSSYMDQQVNAALDLVDKQMGQEMMYVRGRYSQSKSKN